MAGERHLGSAIEDAHARGMAGIVRRQDEGRLAQIELGGEGLHLGVREAVRIGEDGERIAAEASVGEDVDGDELKGFHGLGLLMRLDDLTPISPAMPA